MSPDPVWLPPGEDLVLSSSNVHIWRAFVDQAAPHLPRLAKTLSAGERARAQRFHFERDKRRFIASQGLLRMILSRYLDMDPARIRFCSGPLGKPALEIGSQENIVCFNSSHSADLLLYAITLDREIGIDLEQIRPLPDANEIAARFFPGGEIAALRAIPQDRRLEAFFECWTRKEAYLKSTGEGLLRPLDQFEVSLGPQEPVRLLWVEGDPQETTAGPSGRSFPSRAIRPRWS